MDSDVKAAINSPQLNNIVHQTIQIVIPSPEHACSPVSFPKQFKVDGNSFPIYFLVSGANGACSYAKKVENAKKGLAKGAIIV